MKRGVLAMVAGLAAASALAESPTAADPPCPAAVDIVQTHLLGRWGATFQDLPGANLLLQQHPELAQSVRGAVTRDGRQALVAGDVDAGEFTLEESVDGVRISATWSGTVVDGSCGREIRGDWQGAGDAGPRAFVLRKLP